MGNFEQPSGFQGDMTVTFFTKDPGSGHGEECETFYETDRDSWIVQGKGQGTAIRLQLQNLADDETFLEISSRTMDHFVQLYVKERYGVDLTEQA